MLLTQIHRDFQRVSKWYDPSEAIGRMLEGGDAVVVSRLQAEAKELVAHPSLVAPDEKTLDVCMRWDRFCHELTHAYQDLAMAEVEKAFP